MTEQNDLGTKGLENEDPGESSKNVVEEDIAEKLGNLLEHNEGDKKLLAKMIANPQIRKILEAEQSGKKLMLSEVGEEEKRPDLSTLATSQGVDLGDAEALEGLSRSDFAKVLLGKLNDALSGVVKSGISELANDVGALKEYVAGQEATSVQSQIAKAQKDHKDFNAYKPEMLTFHRANPGLTVEQLYVLTKNEVGDKVPAKVVTERPDTSSSRPKTRERNQGDVPLGRRGMEALLDASLDSQDLSELG